MWNTKHGKVGREAFILLLSYRRRRPRMPSAVAASTLQDGAAGGTTLVSLAGDAFTTREKLGSGRLLGGGASTCSRS